MVGLLDVVLATEKVAIDGGEIDVHALSGSDLAVIITRFPEIGTIMRGKAATLDAEAFMRFLPACIPTLIAFGCGDYDELSEENKKKSERQASRLSIEAQVDLLAAILRLTFRSGVGPFVEKLQRLMLDPVSAVPASSSEQSAPSKNEKAGQT